MKAKIRIGMVSSAEKQKPGQLNTLTHQLKKGLLNVTPMNKKSRGVLESTPSTTPSGTPGLAGSGSSAKKRVSFILARNLEHEARDYMSTISKSPSIPFDASRTPTSGPLLKSKVAHRRFALSPSPRKKALDFF